MFSSFRAEPWFDRPFDKLTVLSKVEGGIQSFFDLSRYWIPDQVRHDIQSLSAFI
jgi:hypothetical protein